RALHGSRPLHRTAVRVRCCLCSTTTQWRHDYGKRERRRQFPGPRCKDRSTHPDTDRCPAADNTIGSSRCAPYQGKPEGTVAVQGHRTTKEDAMKSSKRRDLLRTATALAVGGVAGYVAPGSAVAQLRVPFTIAQTLIRSPAAVICFQCAAFTVSAATTRHTRARWARIPP